MEKIKCKYTNCKIEWDKDKAPVNKLYCSKNCKNKHYAIIKPEMIRAIYKRYYEKNKQKRHEKVYRYINKDPLNKLAYDIRIRTSKYLKSNTNAQNSQIRKLIGLSPKKFRDYLEKQFTKNMSWNNYGVVWNLDHSKSLSLAETKQEMISLAYYTNITPMLCVDNFVKNNK